MKILFTAVLASATLVPGISAKLQAQVCLGSPSRGGIVYVNGKGSGTTKSNGASLSYAPGRLAIGFNGRVIDVSDDEDGFGAGLRLGLILGEKLRICPTAAIGMDRVAWDASNDTKVTTSQLIARGGIGVGYDIMVARAFGIAPFIIGEFVERGNYFKTEVSGNDPTNSGDYKGKGEATYGLLGRFSRVFAGVSASHRLEKGRPDERMIFGGFVF